MAYAHLMSSKRGVFIKLSTPHIQHHPHRSSHDVSWCVCVQLSALDNLPTDISTLHTTFSHVIYEKGVELSCQLSFTSYHVSIYSVCFFLLFPGRIPYTVNVYLNKKEHLDLCLAPCGLIN